MSINNSYNEEAIVKAIAVALDNFRKLQVQVGHLHGRT